MNFYKRHLGDYAKDTRHLTFVEHGAYTVLLDLYYTTEEPFPDDLNFICRKAGARTPEERQAVATILEEFFKKEARANQHESRTIWVQKRADSEIENYNSIVKLNKQKGLMGGRPRKPKKADGFSSESRINPSQIPDTRGHNPEGQKEKIQNQNPNSNPAAKPAAVPAKRSLSGVDQQRNIEARDYRRRKEDEVRKELKVGAGPSSIYESIRLIGKAKTL